MENTKANRVALAFLVLGPLFTSALDAFAQGTNARVEATPAATTLPEPVATPPQQGAPTSMPTTVVVPQPKVTSIGGHVELDNIIDVGVEHLSEWAEKNDAAKVIPYINGRAIRGNYPEELHISKGHLLFHLRITPENKDVWVDLLGEPVSVRRPVTFNVGLEHQAPFASVYDQSNPVQLTVISPFYGAVALIVILVTLILFLWLARTTNIIRYPGPTPIGGQLRPYNLGRAQMAFWFFLIYASYLAIWLITSDLDTITPSLLALMGISAGTALSEAVIDAGKDTAKANQLRDLTAERQALEESISEIQPQVDSINAAAITSATDRANRDGLNKQIQEIRTRLAQIDPQIRALTPQASASVSGGFLNDILSDSSGYSFHRFQIFAWTIVLGIIFVSSVYNNLTMPEFSQTLLGLMGISAGTYIGFKFPEQK